MMTHVLLESNSLRLLQGNYAFDIRLPWYRSLPLSVIQIDEVRIDGAEVALSDVSFDLNGARRPIADMAELTEEYWNVQDGLTLVLAGPATEGEHEVDITLSFFPPYIHDFRRKTRGTQTMKAA